MENRGGGAYSPGRAGLSDDIDSYREGSYRAPVRYSQVQSTCLLCRICAIVH